MESMFSRSPDKIRAARVFTWFTISFFVVSIGIGQLLAQRLGHGSGPWDSHLTWNCHAAGGPYYLKDRPIAEQPCPSPLATSTVKPAGQHEISAAANPAAAARERGPLGLFVLKELFLISTSLGFMVGLVFFYKWLLQHFGTY